MPMKINIDKIKKRLINEFPSFGSIIDCVDYFETENCVGYNGEATLGTNGTTIYYHPDYIQSLTDEEIDFCFAHEICHIALDHVRRGEGKDSEIWNIAADAVINAILKKAGMHLVDGVVDIPEAINYDTETMYDKLMEEKEKNNQTGNPGNNQENDDKKANQKNNTNKFSNHDVGHDTHSFWNKGLINKDKLKEIEKNRSKITQNKQEKEILEKVIKELKKNASSPMGTNGCSYEFEIDDSGLSLPIINWPLILKRPRENVELDWSYQNASLEDGVLSANLEEVATLELYETEIVLDTSGSISDKLLRSFLRECKNILNFSKIKVGCFSDSFYGFKNIKTIKDVDKIKFVGRGGTNFDAAVNAFSKTADNKIIFTDGIGVIPKKKIDAIWIVCGNNKIDTNGGKVIYISEEDINNLIDEHEKPKQLVRGFFYKK